MSDWKRFGPFSYGRDDGASEEIQRNVYVVNWTSDYFSVGWTTSGGLGIWASNRSAKRVGEKDAYVVKRFRGILVMMGFWWFKFYLYLYFDGDGRC
jgi:hypothetical protein